MSACSKAAVIAAFVPLWCVASAAAQVSPLLPYQGGTGLTVIPSTGQVPIGNGQGYVLNSGCQGDTIGTFPSCVVQKGAIGGARGVNMATTTDQALTVPAPPYPYVLSNIVLANCSAVPSALTAGGVYTATGKGGSTLIPAATGYGALGGIGKTLGVALSSGSVTPVSATTLYFSLSVPSGVAATCDVFLYGEELVLPGGQ
jgi:hypothetical protein